MFLVRHPPAKGSGPDAGPTTEGKVQAHRVAKTFMHKGIKKVYTSPTDRTRYQAHAIAHTTGAPMIEDDRLRPWDVRGTSPEETSAKVQHFTANPDDAPDSTDETFNQFKARVKSFHDEHASEPGTVAVTHSKNITAHREVALNKDEKLKSWKTVRDYRVSKTDQHSFKPELKLPEPIPQE